MASDASGTESVEGGRAGPSLRVPRRVAAASLVGTTIEWFDFFIYGTAAALVFNKVFFPAADPAIGTIAALGTFATGFIARPIGGAVFAHFGDRVGRKPMLVYSLLLMGAATVGIGLLPGYATIGVLAPVLLVVLRFAQGFGVGGEWGGAALMAVENAPPHRRGFYGSWPQVGVPLGLVMGTGSFLVLDLTVSEPAFQAWGWRIPFLASAVLIAVGMWIRLTVAESPVFRRDQERREASRLPVLQVLREHPKLIFLAAGSFVATNATFYISSVWLVSYATTELGYTRSTILGANTFLSASDIPMILLLGLLSDRLGRRPLFLGGMALLAVFSIPYFLLVQTGVVGLFILGGLVVQACRSAVYGPQSAYFSELFPTHLRYSGASLSYQLASIVGGLAPAICGLLVLWTGSLMAVAGFTVLLALISLGSSWAMSETLTRGLDGPDEAPARGVAAQA
ncbi:MFS transporter [Actinomycetospora lemnae]|uniref:MFS transporter n=1 Tax=Actinomycetospora lemnae TaxID=3019891 RepID=A0ABT5SWK3_9PSEU|nr:MFS transporter [Actinomycetospora sp. DW7H6]MDD7967144.1 MFS transporter [Actinomycetospora sp. DW7H6]